MVGNDGGNQLLGGSGNDLLDGRGGRDILVGGLGADVFIFRAGEADGDVIQDFGRGERIQLVGFGEDSTVNVNGNRLEIYSGTGIEVIEVRGAPLTPQSWTFVGHVPNIAELDATLLAYAGY